MNLQAVSIAEQIIGENPDTQRPAMPTTIVSQADVVVGLLDHLDQVRSGESKAWIPTGIKALDEKVNLISKGDMTVVGAQSGVGKTIFAHQMAVSAESEGFSVLFFSLEMPPQALLKRTLAAESGVDFKRLTRAKEMTAVEFSKVADAAGGVINQKKNIFYDETRDIDQIVEKIKQTQDCLKETNKPLALVIVDYLQYCSTVKFGNNRHEQVSHISNRLKTAASEMNLAILALAQVNRGVTQRVNQRPINSDLK